MKIILATSGSRGDVQPMIALCLSLKQHGHDLLLVGPPEKKDWASRLGCPYHGLGADVTAFLDTIKNPVSIPAAVKFINYVRNEIHHQFKELPGLVDGADLLVGSSLMFALSTIAESKKIPYRYIVFTPQLFPSVHHPFPVFKTQTLPRWGNWLTWKLSQAGDRFNTTLLINGYRKTLELSPVTNIWRHVLGTNTIAACDAHILPIPQINDQQAIQTGYLHLKMPKPDYPELEAFLNAGPAPIYAGFGSMPPKDQKKHVPMLIQAAEKVNRRLIISRFWNDAATPSDSRNLFFIRNYPHEYLFPKMAAIIHHGGAGTTAMATLSGRPQIIVPHILDQYYHAHKIFMAGIGSQPIWRAKLNLKRLSTALEYCLLNPDISHQAQLAAKTIHPDLSLRNAVKTITRDTSVSTR
jgi:UDP:flavonoid glycosyltransferase YjiC (YdhE family)